MTRSLVDARRADARSLAGLMHAQREATLALVDAIERALAGRLDLPYADEVNPPLWELGHVGWFEEFWIARNSQRHLGHAAVLEAARGAPLLAGADALFDSSRVAHSRRWHIDLPDASRSRALLARIRERTLALLREAGDDDRALYFFRLALLHEAMHHEAGLMIAQHEGLDLGDAAPPPPAAVTRGELAVAGGTLDAATAPDDPGFAFDNEVGTQRVEVAGFTIDSAPVTWRDWLAFHTAGCYDERTHWSDEGWAWRQRALPQGLPRRLARDEGFEQGLKQAWFGRWIALDLEAPAVQLSAHEAQAWCRWAGRRLPTEFEWRLALRQLGEAFDWGQVWEWTDTPFAPWPGFAPHPYRDYSQPWFDGRPVLKGASFATQPWMRDARYRNFYLPGRSDMFAGWRTVKCGA